MKFSEHALKRISQRGISLEFIRIALENGTEIYRNGVLLIFLRKKDIPKEDVNPSVAEKLEGLTIVINTKKNIVITAYKNQKALRNIKKMGR